MRELRPGEFTGPDWSVADDKALQRVVQIQLFDPSQPGGGAGIPYFSPIPGYPSGFPGNAYEPGLSDLNEMLINIHLARLLVPAGRVTDEVVVAWVMHESSWRPAASAFGWSGGKSSAVGLTQITKSAYNLPGYATGRPALLPPTWNEAMLSVPFISIAAGLDMLTRGAAPPISNQLATYKGDGGAQYAQDILAGADLLSAYSDIVGRPLGELDQYQGDELLLLLKTAMNR